MGIHAASITNVSMSKITSRYIRPLKVVKTTGDAYTLDTLTVMQLNLTFYVGRLNRYNPALLPPLCAYLRAHTAVPYEVSASAVL